jgi:hypothetical protein
MQRKNEKHENRWCTPLAPHGAQKSPANNHFGVAQPPKQPLAGPITLYSKRACSSMRKHKKPQKN